MGPRIYGPRGRLVILESPDPMDLLQGRSEAQTLAAACQLIGYETVSFNIRSAREFSETCCYISTITSDHDQAARPAIPLFVHISCHGNNEGLAFRMDLEPWANIIQHISPLCQMRDYKGGFVLSISACGAGQQEITQGLSESFRGGSKMTPPHYLFVTNSESVMWDDATVAWVALYHRIGKLGLGKKEAIQNSLQAIELVTGLSLRYFRWDKTDKRFLRFPGAGNA
jgi:hypothetical protein